MVFFTCNHCGESAKKPAVEKHYNTKCRGMTKNVSCMDCQKDFHGEEYVAHTKCITEAEKYSGKDYVHRESKNSGAKKQESWMDILRSILETREYNLSKQARNAVQHLQSVDNVPRKKQKFQNFVSNCMRIPKGVAEEVWNVLEKELEKMKQVKQAEFAASKAAQEAAKTENGAKENENSKPQQNGTKRRSDENENDNSCKKTKKGQLSDNNIDSTTGAEEQLVIDEFQWIAVLEKIVGKHVDGIILEKLKRKTLKKYKSKLDLEILDEKQQKKFEKKFSKNLKKCTGVQVDGEIVKACQL